jgi:hypothetical protein
VAEDLQWLIRTNRAKYVTFSDEYLKPERLSDLVASIERMSLDMRWLTFARPEARFADSQFTRKLYKSGCRLLMFGIESGSQRVLRSMRKGTNFQHFRPILESCRKANIAVRLDFMLGFPGETKEDAQATFEFLQANKDVIDTPFSSISTGVFELREGIPMMSELSAWGLVRAEPLRGELDDQFRFIDRSGPPEAEIQLWRAKFIRFAKRCMDSELLAPTNKTHQLLLKDQFDQLGFPLPVLDVSPINAASLSIELADGVECKLEVGGLIMYSPASGGEVELAAGLTSAVLSLGKGMPLLDSFNRQHEMDLELFCRLVVFLYRNDFLIVYPTASDTMSRPDRVGVSAIA